MLFQKATFQLLIVKGKEEGSDITQVHVAFLYDQIKFAKLSGYENTVGYFATKGGVDTDRTLSFSGDDDVFDLDVLEING